jgi:UDP-N-acetyl-D-galactosamine dehydrogenase
MPDQIKQIVVIGLGYVGLPLALALARKFPCYGVDIDASRIAELDKGFDRTGEVDSAALAGSSLQLFSTVDQCPPCDFYVITVPTPIDEANCPDLALVRAASRAVGRVLPQALANGLRPVVVFESTVYPGVTEDICGPELEAASGLTCGRDFFLAYSPERINPGDREHTIDKIVKVVSGQTSDVLEQVAKLYSAINGGRIFKAASIKVAEAAKVIENAQRDINIAFMNEIAQIFSRAGIATQDVLAAARTKWNFIDFQPGLVGGHCIGVDPYYLAYCAQQLGINPQVVLAGREINDAMAGWIAGELHQTRNGIPGTALVLGLTFKEDIPDLRNSKVADLIGSLSALGYLVTSHDPHADPKQAQREFGITVDPAALNRTYDLVVLAVAHREYLALDRSHLRGLLNPKGTLADIKRVLGAVADWSL